MGVMKIARNDPALKQAGTEGLPLAIGSVVQLVKRTSRGVRHVPKNMSIDHRGFDMLMAEQVLNFPDIYA